MEPKIKYWLIYAYINSTESGRQSIPFIELETMNRWIERNKDSIIVLAKTEVKEG